MQTPSQKKLSEPGRLSMREKIEKYIREWENNCYSTGLPDEAPAEISDLVPSYKKICIAILRNDYSLKYLGFSPIKSEVYSNLKRIEIAARPKSVIQLKLF